MFEYQSFATLGVNLNRQKYAPLDISQVFSSQADLNYYISKGAKTEGVSEYWYKNESSKIVPYPYPGQIIALVVNRKVTILYLVENEDGTFSALEFDKAPIADDLTVEIIDGKISLAGVNDADANGTSIINSNKKYQPVLIGGKLTWQEVSTTTVEGLDTSIKALETDITNLKAKDTEIEGKIGNIEDGKTLIEIIQEVQNSVAYDDTSVIERIVNAENQLTLLESINAERNAIASVDSEEFAIDEQRKLTIKTVELSKVSGLPEALAQKVDAIEGYSLLSQSGQEKLNAILLRENNVPEFNGVVKVSNVENLNEWIAERANTLTGLSQNNFTDDLKSILETVQHGANENVIEIVKIGGIATTINTKDKSIDIPIATSYTAGVVRGVDVSLNVENSVSVGQDGTMSVNNVNINRLVQTEGEVIILDSGNARN